MSQNHLILVVLIELVIFYLIVYSIKIIRKWAVAKTENFEELSIDLPNSFRQARKEMRFFNLNLKKKFIPQPLTTEEITSIFGEFAANLLKSRVPLLSMDKKIAVLTMLFKIWKIRKRIIATFAQRLLKSAY
jgi:hypothetical protein